MALQDHPFVVVVASSLLVFHVARHLILFPRLITGFVAPWALMYIKDLAIKLITAVVQS